MKELKIVIKQPDVVKENGISICQPPHVEVWIDNKRIGLIQKIKFEADVSVLVPKLHIKFPDHDFLTLSPNFGKQVEEQIDELNDFWYLNIKI